MKEKPVKNASSDQKKLSGKNVVKNRETRKAIDDAIAGKNLSPAYTNIEEMFDELDAEYDDYPEITQKEFDRAVKRKGLKPISEAKEKVSRESSGKAVNRLKKT